MAHLRQYNRLDSEDSGNKKDFSCNSTQIPEWSSSAKLRRTGRLKNSDCSAYTELLVDPEYRQKSTRKSTTRRNRISTTNKKPSISVDLAIQKYYKWSGKLFYSSEVLTEAAEDAGQSFVTTSDYFTQHAAVNIAPHRKTKVYDYMRNFLRKKIFLQSSNEDLTSDYIEAHMVGSSYSADEENDTDSNFSYICRNTDDEDGVADVKCRLNIQSKCKRKPQDIAEDCSNFHSEQCNALSHTLSYTSHSDEELSDVGLSDCCQLLSDKCIKRRSPKREKPHQNILQERRYIIQNIELLQASWYQPHLSSKAANERLRHGTPGDFILLQRGRNYKLSLRLNTKVKHFVILDCGNGYKFKDGKKQFSTLEILITHHSIMAEQLPLTLVLPRSEIFNFGTRHPDDFDSYESLQFLTIIKCMQTKSLDFM